MSLLFQLFEECAQYAGSGEECVVAEAARRPQTLPGKAPSDLQVLASFRHPKSDPQGPVAHLPVQNRRLGSVSKSATRMGIQQNVGGRLLVQGMQFKKEHQLLPPSLLLLRVMS